MRRMPDLPTNSLRSSCCKKSLLRTADERLTCKKNAWIKVGTNAGGGRMKKHFCRLGDGC
jgi:hypothetical protein